MVSFPHRNPYRRKLLSERAEDWLSGVGIVLFMVAVLAICGVYPRGLAAFHISIISTHR